MQYYTCNATRAIIVVHENKMATFTVLGSIAERRAVKKAFRYSERREYEVYDIAEPDVKFELETPGSVQIGNDFELKVLFWYYLK